MCWERSFGVVVDTVVAIIVVEITVAVCYLCTCSCKEQGEDGMQRPFGNVYRNKYSPRPVVQRIHPGLPPRPTCTCHVFPGSTCLRQW